MKLKILFERETKKFFKLFLFLCFQSIFLSFLRHHIHQSKRSIKKNQKIFSKLKISKAEKTFFLSGRSQSHSLPDAELCAVDFERKISRIDRACPKTSDDERFEDRWSLAIALRWAQPASGELCASRDSENELHRRR